MKALSLCIQLNREKLLGLAENQPRSVKKPKRSPAKDSFDPQHVTTGEPTATVNVVVDQVNGGKGLLTMTTKINEPRIANHFTVRTTRSAFSVYRSMIRIFHWLVGSL